MTVKVKDDCYEKADLYKLKCRQVFCGTCSVNGHTDLSLKFYTIMKFFTHMHVTAFQEISRMREILDCRSFPVRCKRGGGGVNRYVKKFF